ncbi:MAG TPA: HDOD domain-containing protein [Vicinamibacterales bacterium]|nr:HDOD domain-containing protein [Vicinamibacterales bacterium]
MASAPESYPQAPDRLEFHVRRVVEGTELPMFSKRLVELLALPNSDHTSAQKLAALVLEDYALTFKLLRMANSFHYNRSNKPIESISHAIVVLGMRTVLKLASTLTYLEYFERHAGELRQLMVRSMLSAHVAAVTADLRRFPQREEAYLAGMFQNLGEVLVAHHSPLRRAAIRTLVDEGMAQDEAAARELGFTYDRLATAVGFRWKLSPYLMSLWDSDATPMEVTGFARFGHDLTQLMCVRAAAHQEPGLKLLGMKYGVPLRVSVDGIADIWERAVEDTRSTFANLGVSQSALGAPLGTGTS